MKRAFCLHCHSVSSPRKVNAGSGVVSVLLLLGFLFAAMVDVIAGAVVGVLLVAHIIDRGLRGNRDVCRICGGSSLVPADSPRARAEMAGGPARPDKIVIQRKKIRLQRRSETPARPTAR